MWSRTEGRRSSGAAAIARRSGESEETEPHPRQAERKFRLQRHIQTRGRAGGGAERSTLTPARVGGEPLKGADPARPKAGNAEGVEATAGKAPARLKAGAGERPGAKRPAPKGERVGELRRDARLK